MKARKVSALRSKRGSHRMSGAEPQVVGLAPQTTMMTERANTMKTYILRSPKTVEPQKHARRWSARRASKSPATCKRKARRLFAAALWLGHIFNISESPPIVSDHKKCRNQSRGESRKRGCEHREPQWRLVPLPTLKVKRTGVIDEQNAQKGDGENAQHHTTDGAEETDRPISAA